jgi:DNA-directed RNA polymerase beta' subunit
LKEGRIDTTVTGWEVDLIDGTIWDEISEICNTAITSEQLSFEDQLKNIVIAGSELLKTLIQKEQEEEKNNPEEEVTETVTTTEETTEEVVDDYDDMVYYDPYFYDPYYVSPCWGFYYGTPYYW